MQYFSIYYPNIFRLCKLQRQKIHHILLYSQSFYVNPMRVREILPCLSCFVSLQILICNENLDFPFKKYYIKSKKKGKKKLNFYSIGLLYTSEFIWFIWVRVALEITWSFKNIFLDIRSLDILFFFLLAYLFVFKRLNVVIFSFILFSLDLRIYLDLEAPV